MIMSVTELESAIAFNENKAKAARLLMDASYKAAEDGEDDEVIRLMRYAVGMTLDAKSWEITYVVPAPMPWESSPAHLADNSDDLD